MKYLLLLLILVIMIISMSSCATIVGGPSYYAKVQVPNHPTAKIEYRGKVRGEGEVSFRAKRQFADRFSVKIMKDGCETEIKSFTGRKFRGWAFFGSLVGWTFAIGVVPVPLGIIVDGATGAWWKPDINEKGVTKQDYNHYMYRIDYTGCQEKGE